MIQPPWTLLHPSGYLGASEPPGVGMEPLSRAEFPLEFLSRCTSRTTCSLHTRRGERLDKRSGRTFGA